MNAAAHDYGRPAFVAAPDGLTQTLGDAAGYGDFDADIIDITKEPNRKNKRGRHGRGKDKPAKDGSGSSSHPVTGTTVETWTDPDAAARRARELWWLKSTPEYKALSYEDRKVLESDDLMEREAAVGRLRLAILERQQRTAKEVLDQFPVLREELPPSILRATLVKVNGKLTRLDQNSMDRAIKLVVSEGTRLRMILLFDSRDWDVPPMLRVPYPERSHVAEKVRLMSAHVEVLEAAGRLGILTLGAMNCFRDLSPNDMDALQADLYPLFGEEDLRRIYRVLRPMQRALVAWEERARKLAGK